MCAGFEGNDYLGRHNKYYGGEEGKEGIGGPGVGMVEASTRPGGAEGCAWGCNSCLWGACLC
jgi:hypothetical protein